MIYAIIELGAASIRLSLYKFENDKIILVLSKKSSAGLVGYIESGYLVQKGIQKACSVLNDFKDILYYFEGAVSYVFAEAALSSAVNIEDVMRQLEENTGFRIELLSGEDQAQLGYLGCAHLITMDSGLFVDVGGGSTELVLFDSENILKALSIPYGSLTMSLKHIKGITPHKSNILNIKHELKRELKRTKLFDIHEKYDICASGGTARTARKLYNDIYDLPLENNIMEFEKFSNIVVKFNEERRDIIRRLKQLAPDRIHTIIPGIVVLQMIAGLCQSAFIIVSNYGSTEGYLLKKVLRNDINEV